ncbi:MAG: rhomboid family intramembrane serine protease [Desulfobacteraceae bacterium]|nr:MAG: rhomboid family intramembrane serine protease [Desulfobacteraceae bacterium]
MIPIRDTTPSRNVPVVNHALIAINVVVFMVEMMQGRTLDRFIFTYGLVPARYTVEGLAGHFSFAQQIFAWISFMFLHGGFLHLLGNMWSLHIFGDNVEDRLGPLRYLVFYLLCGITSGISHLILNAASTAPTIGASGAIAGVMGAYFLLHPTSRILTLIPILFIPWFVEIPAFFFLGFWFLMQFFSATASGGTAGGIAWWAHIGGFVFGMFFLKLFVLLPGSGATARMRRMTAKKHSHRLQVVHPDGGREADIHATIAISPYEALVGARKMVSVPFGLQQRLFRVTVPPGIPANQTLRLRGQGRVRPDGNRGDLLLRVVIR